MLCIICWYGIRRFRFTLNILKYRIRLDMFSLLEHPPQLEWCVKNKRREVVIAEIREREIYLRREKYIYDEKKRKRSGISLNWYVDRHERNAHTVMSAYMTPMYIRDLMHFSLFLSKLDPWIAVSCFVSVSSKIRSQKLVITV